MLVLVLLARVQRLVLALVVLVHVLVVLVLVPAELVALVVLVLLVLVAHVLQAQALVVLVLLAAEVLVLVAVVTIARMVSVEPHVRSHVGVVVATWTSCSRSSVPTTPQVMLRFQKAPSSSSVECRHKSLRQN